MLFAGGCDPRSEQEHILLSDQTYQHQLIDELRKAGIDYTAGDADTVWFSKNDKHAVYRILQKVLDSDPAEKIEASCEPPAPAAGS